MLQLKPQAEYNFGSDTFSIDLSCFLDRKDCRIAYSIDGFHTVRNNIRASSLETLHTMIFSVKFDTFCLSFTVLLVRVSAGDL